MVLPASPLHSTAAEAGSSVCMRVCLKGGVYAFLHSFPVFSYPYLARIQTDRVPVTLSSWGFAARQPCFPPQQSHVILGAPQVAVQGKTIWGLFSDDFLIYRTLTS